ncbi:MAG TPA: mycofactocin-coupled SDR family oxidoreductase [Acidimicrobiales bacterium]|nr:mycofactocin-coupled SDR family oxidoreductase [Acidimicrobiales bacterium]
MGRLDGKVAFITGAARGQGRSHAVRLAQEGADIIAIDIAAQIDSVPYQLATQEDLNETVQQVEALGRQIVASEADVRDYDQLCTALDAGVKELGRLDIVSANAGIISFSKLDILEEQAFRDVVDVNLTGVWHTAKAAIPHLRAGGEGGSIVITSSSGGLRAAQNIGHYVAAKHGLVGLMRTLALELAPDNIRVNSLHPTAVNTDLVLNNAVYRLFAPDLPEDQLNESIYAERSLVLNALPVPWVEAIDVSNALLWLASSEARFVTGVALPIDAGANIK